MNILLFRDQAVYITKVIACKKGMKRFQPNFNNKDMKGRKMWEYRERRWIMNLSVYTYMSLRGVNKNKCSDKDWRQDLSQEEPGDQQVRWQKDDVKRKMFKNCHKRTSINYASGKIQGTSQAPWQVALKEQKQKVEWQFNVHIWREKQQKHLSTSQADTPVTGRHDSMLKAAASTPH